MTSRADTMSTSNPADGHHETLFEHAGGERAIHRLEDAFYAKCSRIHS